MDATTQRELVFDVARALRAVPRGTWRQLGKAEWSRDDELVRKHVAEAVVEHLLRSRWTIERKPGGGMDFGSGLHGPGGR
jgi:hypothetical protein